MKKSCVGCKYNFRSDKKEPCRLIDADYLKEHLYQCEVNSMPLHRMFTEIDELFDVIDNVPTVLEAEVEE